MRVGSMRVSSDNDRQTTDLQRDALLEAGVDPRQLFADKASGARADRPGLQQALAYVQPGDCLIVWKLDRLGRSLPHLLQIVTTLHARGVAFRSLTEQMDTTTPQGAFLFSVFGALGRAAAPHLSMRGWSRRPDTGCWQLHPRHGPGQVHTSPWRAAGSHFAFDSVRLLY